MRKKNIKTFSVDVEAYDALVAMFRESGAEVSVSYYVDKCLKELARYLETMKTERAQSEKWTVPMSFIIDRVVRAPIISLADSLPSPGMFHTEIEEEVNDWQLEYEAQMRNISREFLVLVKSKKFVLSADKKYVTNVKSGIKYTLDRSGELVEVPDGEDTKGVRE